MPSAPAWTKDPLHFEWQVIAQKFNLENAFTLEVETRWNGTNSYGFVVPEVPEEFGVHSRTLGTVAE